MAVIMAGCWSPLTEQFPVEAAVLDGFEEVGGGEPARRHDERQHQLARRDFRLQFGAPAVDARQAVFSAWEYCPIFAQTGTFRCFLPDPTSSPGIS